MKFHRRFSIRSGLTVIFLASLFFSSISAAQETEGDIWPREIDVKGTKILMYQPQLESFEGDILEGRSAVSVTKKGETMPVFGAVWFAANMRTDKDSRMVFLVDIKISAIKFPEISEEHSAALTSILEEEIPKWDIEIALDALLADLEVGDKANENLNMDPPEIIFRTTPSALVLIDGDPKLQDIENTNYKYVVNSAFSMVHDPGSGKYWLRGGGLWYSSKEILEGYKPDSKPPKDLDEMVRKAEEEAKKKDEEAMKKEGIDPEEAAKDEPKPASPPEIFVRTKAAELVQTDGDPDFAAIEGTELLYLKNTSSDIIMDITTQQYYILLAGRWFTSKTLTENKWTYVAQENLPEEFANIPSESDMATVRASVAGTIEAKEAVLENDIPQTAEIDRKDAKLEVKYDGDPQFEKIGETGMKYAVNTDKSVLLISGRYYCCDEAIWFESAGPMGPWEVSTKVPDAVQDIPAESPVYNVKYVYIYDSTPEVVYVGYTPAYYGSYYYGGCVVYGTGYYYYPWYGAYYYPRPVTWGFGVHYNPWTGWGFSVGVSAGWFRIGFGRPMYRGYWGARGYRHGYRHGYHHGYRHGARAGYRAGYRAGQRSNNMYSNRSSGVRNTSTRARTSSSGRAGNLDRSRATTGKKNNVMTDKSGNVYRKTDQGWDKRDNGSWKKDNSIESGRDRSSTGDRSGTGDRAKTGDRSSSNDRSSTKTQQPQTNRGTSTKSNTGSRSSTKQSSPSRSSQLNKDHQSRQRSSQQSKSYNNSRSSSQSRGGRSGGSRGGGGRRR